jgi:hypothetical protein
MVDTTLPVNWIYGAYIPKDAPFQPLSGEQRFKLYLRQTYTTPGIYVKTALFSIHDQVNESEPDWGDGSAPTRITSQDALRSVGSSFSY